VKTTLKAMALAPLAMAGALTSATLAMDDVIAVSWSGDIYTIDSTTGAGNLLNGSRSFIGLNASAKNSAGEIYTSSGTTLVKVDPTTGAMTAVATMDISSLRGMAFAPNDRLYAYNDEGFGTPDVLYSINTSNGAVTRIGLANDTGIQGMAIDSQGRAYAWDIINGLATVNLLTGATADVSGLPGSGDIQCIAFDGNDDLYGGRNAFYSINLGDGAITTIGSGGYTDVRGLEFLGGGGGLRLRVDGACPGQITVSWSGATPGRPMAIVHANTTGSFVIPGGPCGGTQLGLGSAGIRVAYQGATGPNGSGDRSSRIGTGVCRHYLQMVVVSGSPCETSNVAQIP